MNFLLYAIAVCVWGSTWLTITYQLGSVPIDISIFYRFALASFLIFMWCFVRNKPLKFSWPIHLSFMSQGFFLFSMNYVASYTASYSIPSGLNAIGFSTVLIFNIINSFIFYQVPLTLPILCGTLSGMIGIITIFWPSIAEFNMSNESFFGILLSLLGGMLASFGTMISLQNHKKSIPVTESNAYAMGYGALIMLGVIFMKGTPFQFDLSYTYIFSLLHLSIFGTIVAFGCYLTLLRRIGPNRVGYTSLATPVVALALSTLFENFAWNLYIVCGVGFIMLGNIIILSRPSVPKIKITEKKPIPFSAFKKAA